MTDGEFYWPKTGVLFTKPTILFDIEHGSYALFLLYFFDKKKLLFQQPNVTPGWPSDNRKK